MSKKTIPNTSSTGGALGDETASALLLQAIFAIIIMIVMFLCFFALSTNMAANLFEQAKEIGVLRSIGFTKNRVRILYFYEAFILVFVSCLMGMLIGIMLGLSFALQEAVLLDIETKFVFPSIQLGIIFLCSLICAFFATFGPATQLTKKEIALIFKIN